MHSVVDSVGNNKNTFVKYDYSGILSSKLTLIASVKLERDD